MRLPLIAKRRLVACAFASMFSMAASPAAAQSPNYIVWWQSFTTPASPFQQLVTGIGLTHFESSGVLFEIFAFNGTYLTGSSLWQAPLQSVHFDEAEIFNPFISLAPNTRYAFTMAATSGSMTQCQFDSYPGGEFAINLGETTSLLPVGPADIDGFHVEFQSVVPVTPAPEPTSLALLASGFLGMFGLARARRAS